MRGCKSLSKRATPVRLLPTRLVALVGVAWLFPAAAPQASGQVNDAPPAPATRPAYPELERLNAECVTLMKRMDGSVLRVQVPGPRWNNDVANEPRFNRFNLNDGMKQGLQQRANRGPNAYETDNTVRGGNSATASVAGNGNAAPSTPTSPSQHVRGAAGDNKLSDQQAQGYTIIVPPQQPAAEQQQLQQAVINSVALGNRQAFVANSVGLVLSDRHVLVPTFMEREAVADQPIRLACTDGTPVFARFVGSDQQTQLTVLQLSDPEHVVAKVKEAKKADAPAAGTPPSDEPCIGKPVALADAELPDGSVILMLSPIDGIARLSIWNGTPREVGVVLTIDGRVAGIARQGQFLSGGACRLIADQIIRHGTVRRATLGIIISQVEPGDPARQVAELGDRPAVRIDQVMKGSVAEAGGLRKGDLILSLAGEPVHNIPTLAAAVAARQGLTELKVMRDGKVMSMRVDLVQN